LNKLNAATDVLEYLKIVSKFISPLNIFPSPLYFSHKLKNSNSVLLHVIENRFLQDSGFGSRFQGVRMCASDKIRDPPRKKIKWKLEVEKPQNTKKHQ
jgi:hypothetical protein